MKIDSLEMRALKGRSQSLTLQGVNIIHGPNFAGKTAIFDAIRLGIMGFLPELGKRNSDAFQLCSDREMSVSIQMSTGDSITRTWKLGGTSVQNKTIGQLPPEIERTISLLLNPSEYFTLSQRKRIDYVLGLIDTTADGKISKSLRTRLASFDESIRSDLVAILNVLDKKNLDISEYLDLLVQKVKELQTEKRALRDRMSKTIEGLADLRQMESALKDVDEQEITKSRSILIEEQKKLEAEKSAINNTIEINRRSAERRNKLQATINDKAIVNVMPVKERRDALDKSVESIRKEIDELRDQQLTPTRTAIASQKTTVSYAKRDLKAVEDERDQFDGLDCCPVCGASGDAWKEPKLKELNSKIVDLKKKLERENKKLKLLEEECSKMEKQYGEWNAELQKSISARDKTTSEMDETLRVNREVENARTAIASIQIIDIDENRIDVINARLEEINTLTEDLEVKLTDVRDMRSSIANAAKANEEFEKSDEALRGVTEALRVVEEKKADVVKSAFDAILVPANRLVDGILRSPLAYYGDEIGYWRDGHWVSFKAFSGTEQALAYMAVSAGIASMSPFKLILLDEIARLDIENQDRLISRVNHLVHEGVIDQFVGIIPHPSHMMEALGASGDIALVKVS